MIVEYIVLAEEVLVCDADSALWAVVRPLLDAALRLEQNDETYSWHGWRKSQVNAFLQRLPSRCSVIAGMWETGGEAEAAFVYEPLILGVVCEVMNGQVCSIRTFEALTAGGLKPVQQLEPGIDDALEIMRQVKMQVAPVAWALFTDRLTWNEWLLSEGDDASRNGSEGAGIDKGELLAVFAHQGRCVLLGSQAAHHHR